jgi:hypothetical protein
MRFLPTSIASALVVAATSLALAAPATAVERGVVYDGDDPGPGWAKGRGGTTAGDEGPLWLSSPAGTMAAPSGPGMITPGGPTDHEERGGASARW